MKYNARYFRKNRARLLAARKIYYRKNRAKIIEYNRQRRVEKREEISIKYKAWRVANPVKAIDSNVRRRYGISAKEWMALRTAAKKCLICGYVFKRAREKHVDHCHRTRKVRGVLCSPCNLALGLFRDDVRSVSNAVKYLRRFA